LLPKHPHAGFVVVPGEALKHVAVRQLLATGPSQRAGIAAPSLRNRVRPFRRGGSFDTVGPVAGNDPGRTAILEPYQQGIVGTAWSGTQDKRAVGRRDGLIDVPVLQ